LKNGNAVGSRVDFLSIAQKPAVTPQTNCRGRGSEAGRREGE